MNAEGYSQQLTQAAAQLLAYCRRNNWAGYDPYDALNSAALQNLPLRRSKSIRLVLTQFLKRSPVNLRPLLLVPKTHNPKGLALFVMALSRLSRLELGVDESEIRALADLLLRSRTPGTSEWSWGYSFDWQTRTELVPRGSPNIICTTFAANALLDAHEHVGGAEYRTAGVEAARFILGRLYCEEGGRTWFNYTPLERTQIHNANLLGAALLSRVAKLTGETALFTPALAAARFSVERQNADGSWYYGERDLPSQKWIDNFHTGFNLCALRSISEYAETLEFESSIHRGLAYYVDHFFENGEVPKYFHNKTYPVDIHSVAQSLITLERLKEVRPESGGLVVRVFDWALKNMQDRRGYFYFQKHRFWTNRIPYMRWSQAWMLLALAELMENRLAGQSSGVATIVESRCETVKQ